VHHEIVIKFAIAAFLHPIHNQPQKSLRESIFWRVL